jgi:hypothetical protein
MCCSDASVEFDSAADSAPVAPADGDDADIRTKKRGQDEAGHVVLLGMRANAPFDVGTYAVRTSEKVH